MKGMGGMQQMLKQANQMQRKMEKLQEDLKQRVYEAKAGGDGVSVKLKGDSELVEIEIHEDLKSDADFEMITDLVKVAVNEAIKKAKEEQNQEMSKISGGMGGLLGGMF